MVTVFFYTFILLSSTLFMWLSENYENNNKKYFFLMIAFLLVFVPSSIRNDIGTDFMAYVNIYDNIENSTNVEYGYYFINWILSLIDANVQWVFIVSSFIFTLVVFKSYPSKHAWIIHFVFISTLWFMSFNQVRQSLAIAFSLLALVYFLNGRTFIFVVVSLFGVLFHKSVVFIIMVGLLSLIPLKSFIKNQLSPLLFIVMLAIVFFNPESVFNPIESFLDILGLDKYSNYFSNTRHFVSREDGTGLGVLVKVLFSIYFILNAKSILELDKKYWFVILLVFLYAFFLILANEIVIFSRAARIFSISLIFATYILYISPINQRLNRLVVFCFLIFLLAAFIKTSFIVKNIHSDPKRNPYQTIFNKA